MNTDQIEVVCETLNQMRSSNYSALSALTIMLYDTIITFDREYVHIWKAKWSLPKVLYFCIRYYGICYVGVTVIITTRMNIPIDACKRYLWWTSLGGPIVFTTLVNVVLILRLHALYNQNRKVLLFLGLTILTEFSIELYTSIKTSLMTTSAVFSAPFGLPFTGCLTTVETKYTLLSWIPCLVVAFVFFFMTAYQFFRTIQKSEGRLWGFWRMKSFSPLLLAFFRDGTVFFFVIAVTLLVCTLINTLVVGPFQGVFVPCAYTYFHITISIDFEIYVAGSLERILIQDQGLFYSSEKLRGSSMEQPPGAEQSIIKRLRENEIIILLWYPWD
ncbi:hypothetical protein BDQ17DRAFT_1428965 [Cyathus striatus]|nr:hypothetical protein BDQ17DRAFT_1428965 [Cyathus striatus]